MQLSQIPLPLLPSPVRSTARVLGAGNLSDALASLGKSRLTHPPSVVQYRCNRPHMAFTTLRCPSLCTPAQYGLPPGAAASLEGQRSSARLARPAAARLAGRPQGGPTGTLAACPAGSAAVPGLSSQVLLNPYMVPGQARACVLTPSLTRATPKAPSRCPPALPRCASTAAPRCPVLAQKSLSTLWQAVYSMPCAAAPPGSSRGLPTYPVQGGWARRSKPSSLPAAHGRLARCSPPLGRLTVSSRGPRLLELG